MFTMPLNWTLTFRKSINANTFVFLCDDLNQIMDNNHIFYKKAIHHSQLITNRFTETCFKKKNYNFYQKWTFNKKKRNFLNKKNVEYKFILRRSFLKSFLNLKTL